MPVDTGSGNSGVARLHRQRRDLADVLGAGASLAAFHRLTGAHCVPRKSPDAPSWIDERARVKPTTTFR
jgi:hypothetical protein